MFLIYFPTLVNDRLISCMSIGLKYEDENTYSNTR